MLKRPNPGQAGQAEPAGGTSNRTEQTEPEPGTKQNQTVSKQRIIIARRKRWLQKLARYGLINQAKFTLRMKQIKAKDWNLRLKQETTRQSGLLEPDDIIGDLSNRNKGESVVKISDISLPKTSR